MGRYRRDPKVQTKTTSHTFLPRGQKCNLPAVISPREAWPWLQKLMSLISGALFFILVLLIFGDSLITCCTTSCALKDVLSRISHYREARSMLWHPQVCRHYQMSSGGQNHPQLRAMFWSSGSWLPPRSSTDISKNTEFLPERFWFDLFGAGQHLWKPEMPTCRQMEECALRSYQLSLWCNWTQHKIHCAPLPPQLGSS